MSQPVADDIETSYNGTRKLIRPHLPTGVERRREPRVLALLTHALTGELHSVDSSHAEAFYFQKQIQLQTEMTVVLDDGEPMSGVIEWYDRCVIKLRTSGRRRILIYKSAIKYMYKTGELSTPVSE